MSVCKLVGSIRGIAKACILKLYKSIWGNAEACISFLVKNTRGIGCVVILTEMYEVLNRPNTASSAILYPC